MGKRPRTPAADGPKGGDGFMLLFTTLSLIILAFFILLNSMAVIDTNRQKAALGSLMGSFGLMPGGIGTDQDKTPTLGNEASMVSSGLALVFDDVRKEISSLRTHREVQGEVSVTFDKEKGVVRVLLTENMLYSSGSVVLSPMVFPLLDKLAASVARNDALVEVIGHTDDRKGPDSNWLLSLKRGVSIARYLEDAAKMVGRVKASGAAEYQPMSDNGSADGRATNRRVEILITRSPEAI